MAALTNDVIDKDETFLSQESLQDDNVEHSQVSQIRDAKVQTVNVFDNCDSLLDKNTCLVSYNLHGLNQTRSCVRDLIDMTTVSPGFLFTSRTLVYTCKFVFVNKIFSRVHYKRKISYGTLDGTGSS